MKLFTHTNKINNLKNIKSYKLDISSRYDIKKFAKNCLRRDFNDFRLTDLNFDLSKVLEVIYQNKNFQNPNSLVYKTFKRLLNLRFTLDFFKNKKIKKFLNLKINFPYIEQGNISSIHLFGIDELIIFMHYISSKKNIKRFVILAQT